MNLLHKSIKKQELEKLIYEADGKFQHYDNILNNTNYKEQIEEASAERDKYCKRIKDLWLRYKKLCDEMRYQREKKVLDIVYALPQDCLEVKDDYPDWLIVKKTNTPVENPVKNDTQTPHWLPIVRLLINNFLALTTSVVASIFTPQTMREMVFWSLALLIFLVTYIALLVYQNKHPVPLKRHHKIYYTILYWVPVTLSGCVSLYLIFAGHDTSSITISIFVTLFIAIITIILVATKSLEMKQDRSSDELKKAVNDLTNTISSIFYIDDDMRASARERVTVKTPPLMRRHVQEKRNIDNTYDEQVTDVEEDN